jgi:carboxyl-terminal processing protease
MSLTKIHPKITLVGVRKLIIFLVIVMGVFSLGYILGNKGYEATLQKGLRFEISRENPIGKEKIDFSLFWRVWDTLEKSYFDKSKINYSKMVYGAISGLVSSLGDPYTAFLPPTENKLVEEDLSGSFEGVGIQIGFKGTQLAVIAPLPGTPAEKAGLKAGDYIIGIKDESKKIDMGTMGISAQDAVQVIRGKSGTKVTLALLREGSNEPLVVELTRAKVDVPSVILTYVGEEEKIARIQLLKFGEDTDKEWDKAISEILKNQNITKVILDLRNNPGGYLEQAVDIAGEFVERGETIVKEDRGGGLTKNYPTERVGLLLKIPMVVLVNGGSASASEILAGALKDIKKVILVGEKTFGKGTIQEPLQLESGAGLHITVARWLTPGGVWVNDKGLEPDVLIEDDVNTSADEQLNKAIELLN